MTVSRTARFGLTVWSDDRDMIDHQMFDGNVVAVDGSARVDQQGASAGIGSPQPGFWYLETDTLKQYVGVGSRWVPVLGRVDETYTKATLPAAGNPGVWYYTSDTQQVFRDNGTTLVEIVTAPNAPAESPPAVGTVITMFNFGTWATGQIDTETAPAGWLRCDGSAQSVTTYPNLFNVIGYTYGGSGGTFNLPNSGLNVGPLVWNSDQNDNNFPVWIRAVQ